MIIKPNNPDTLIRFLSSKPLILYGMGDTGIRIAKWCDEHGINYIFADKNANQLKLDFNKKVITINEILADYKDANIVVSSIVYSVEITNELIQKGIDENRIYQYSLFTPDEVSWSELESNKLADWELMSKRFEMISDWKWIPEDVKIVADYGAGHMFLKEYLPQNSIYYPIDYIDRGQDTIICDFNKGEYPDIRSELSACTATLMCVKPAYELVKHICLHTVKTVIFSYVTIEGFSDINARRRSSICNDFSTQEIINMFENNNFNLRETKSHDNGNSTMTFFLFESGE